MSVAEHAGAAAIGVLLTGMGDDGAKGLLAIRRRGGRTLAQDKESCAVFGMPAAAQRLGAVDDMLPPAELATAIARASRESMLVTPADELETAVDRVGALLDARIGLRPQSTLRGRLRRCIRDEIQARDQDLDAYIEVLTNSNETLQSLVNRVTVQESGFFRHPDHFEVLADDVLPMIGQSGEHLERRLCQRPGGVQLGDASSGAGRSRIHPRLRPVHQRSGAHRRRQVHHPRDRRPVTASSADPSDAQDDNGWQVNHSLRDRVSTMRHNLMEELPDRVGRLPGGLLPKRADLLLGRPCDGVPEPARGRRCLPARTSSWGRRRACGR